MGELTTITLDGVEYVRADEVSKEPTNTDIKIVILQRGWVAIGRYSEEENDMCVLSDASIIRSWGTSKGLGELALEGKQPNTKLDKTGTIRFHKLTSVGIIDANSELWTNNL